MVSILIAVRNPNNFLNECIQHCLSLNFADYEIIVLPDQEFDYAHERVRVIPTGSCLPALKRDKGASQAKGEILAFIDDDAYPCPDWLSRAILNFKDPEIAAVAGPAITPPTEEFLRQASGLVYGSFAVSGNFRYRYFKCKKRFVDDYPSCNLLVRKEIFEQLGGFRTNFWPGEDTIFCLEITKRLKKKIIYDPDAFVFHHRRPLFLPHLRQIKNYALHRGYFVKRFPETSLRGQYFLPTLLLLWIILGFIFSIFNSIFLFTYVLSIVAYVIFVYLNSFQKKNLKMTDYVVFGTFLTHICYGFYFLCGLFQSKLKEEKIEQ